MARALSKEFRLQARIFLVGCSRSGTTVVQRCLGAHPRLTSFPETDFLGKLVGGWSGRLQARFDRVRTDRRQLAFRRLAETLQRPELERVGNEHLGFRAAIDSLVTTLDDIAIGRGAMGWVEKTPKHFRYVGLLMRTIPDTRFIHLVRDGRDVVASLVDRARQHPQFSNRLEPLDAVRLWNESIRMADRYSGRTNNLVLAYEDFVHDSEAELRRVCDFLDLAYDEAMIEARDGDAIVNADETWKSGADRPVTQQRSKFRELLNETEQRSVMKALDWRRYQRLFPDGVGAERAR